MTNGIWKDSLVTLIDLIDTKSIAEEGNARATTLMRKLHSLVQREMAVSMRLHSHAYCWNDSALLLAHLDRSTQTSRSALNEISALKKKIDLKVGRTYAICIKGRTFPDKNLHDSSSENSADEHARCVVIKASSYAMGNCYRVEERARRKKLCADWYIDCRVAKSIPTRAMQYFYVDMLPSRKRRRVYMANGYLHPEPRNS
ncbi:hypothetical protein E4T66_02455 [Sinimarinibacterium sp. CAU 1509]|uniref:hypothetical protein n=1 Tax=Sinimarinibacterium sp. CAU 1509 TaxID=2562283 RepID=UPI0010ADA561|nr:hypothetical protein [Sinimarinibacterium sp. CAU 1509]TJY65106.1 hypothetical protein E4T66_02455 [Sinimarinibacterium sp. CAU 1509]